jgi:hypothetical protein
MIYDRIWYDIWYDTIRHDMIWYMIWYDTTRHDMIYDMIWYDIVVFVNCNWVATQWQQYSTHLHTNSTVQYSTVQYSTVQYSTVQYSTVQYTFTHKQYTERHKNFGTVRAVPRLCQLYPGICLTTEEKARRNLSQLSRWSRTNFTPALLLISYMFRPLPRP